MKQPRSAIFFLLSLKFVVLASSELRATEGVQMRSLMLDESFIPQEKPYFLRTEGGFELLRSGVMRRGPIQEVFPENNSIKLYQQVITEDDELWIPVREIPLPEGNAQDLLLLFLEKNRAPIMLDDSQAAHPLGSIRMLNTTTFDLVGMIGEERFNLNPGEDRVRLVAQDELTPIRLAVSHEGQWIPIKSITTRVRPDRRILCLGRFVRSAGDVYFDMTPVQDRPTRRGSSSP